jgi:tRNA A-37 threonylcarbamoyl transferase component Bud32
MGEVYLAYDRVHQRTVALKLLLESLSAEPEYRARFEREARIAAGLREHHIIPIHTFGEIDNRLYIDMRLVEGEDLAGLLGRERALAPRRAVGILRQIASALDAAHRAGLVHRDVKPANVLLAGEPSGAADAVYLADFGIVRETAQTGLTATGVAVGTPAYMAPERFSGRTVDHRVDVYALGCILYEMLTGNPPYAGSDYPALLFQHLNAQPARPSAVRPDLPRALDLVVATSMAKDPEARYQSAGELAADAEAALATMEARRRPDLSFPSDEHPTARPTTVEIARPAALPQPVQAPPQATPPPSPPERSRRRRWPWFAGAGVAAAAATAVVVFLGVLRAPSTQADLTLEGAGVAGAGAFAPDFRAGPTPSSGGSSLPAGIVDTGAVSGATEGIYRAVKGGSPCDRDGLSAFFMQNPSIADLWVRAVAGDPVLATTEAFRSVTATTLPGYIAALTPVLLRADTQVTAFARTADAVAARQSVLQAGTAVLVDERGLPRLRCHGATPLTSPARNTPTANRAGDPWPGFELRATVVMTPAANPLHQFGLADPTGATIFRRPAGSAGAKDIDQVPQTALLEGAYVVQGTQVACSGLKSCDTQKPMTMTVQLRNCSPTQCTISANAYWDGEFPLVATDGRWSGAGPTGLDKADACNGVDVPDTAIDLTLRPGDFAVDANAVWRANSLAGTVRRHSGKFADCNPSSRTWDATAKRTVAS